MIRLSSIVKYIIKKDYRFAINAAHGYYHSMPDDEYLKRMFKSTMGYDLDLDNPMTLNEKLNWLKLYDRKPIYTTMVDKYEAKKFIGDRVIPTLGVWDHFEDIDFDVLPNQFVLKTTHDSGGVVVCKEKTAFDIESAKRTLNRSLKREYYYLFREWPYKDVKPRIIAEKFLKDDVHGDLRDYKFYTFHGEPKLFCIITDRGGVGGAKANFYDMNFNELDFTWGFPHPERDLEIPHSIAKMVELARLLAKDTYQLRVDFYESCGSVYCGELTLFDGAGLEKIEPAEWDMKLGSLLQIPSVR